jgi:hypothetical protein
VVDPSQVSLQSVDGVVGEQHVEGIAAPLQFGELGPRSSRPSSVSGTLTTERILQKYSLG